MALNADFEMPKELYELIVSLTELAVYGLESMQDDAVDFQDRKRVAEAEGVVTKAQFLVNEYDERHRFGDLK